MRLRGSFFYCVSQGVLVPTFFFFFERKEYNTRSFFQPLSSATGRLPEDVARVVARGAVVVARGCEVGLRDLESRSRGPPGVAFKAWSLSNGVQALSFNCQLNFKSVT